MTVNAKMLATFLESVEAEEALLMQQLCDRESTVMRAGLSPRQLTAEPSSAQPNSEASGPEVKEDPSEVYGEF